MTTMNDNNIVNKLRDRGEKDARVFLTVLSIINILVLIVIIVSVIATAGGEGAAGVTGFIFVMFFYIGLFAFSNYLMENLIAAGIRINGIRVTDEQLPELSAVVRQCAEKLGVKPPEVYVLQDSMWNAFAMKVGRKKMIVLLSGAVDSLLLKGDMNQLSWVVAHEMGHHVCGHLTFWNRFIEVCSISLPWIILWHRRRGELSCDRIAMYCVGSAEASFRALANMTVGAQMADKINTDLAISQWHKYKNEFFSKYRTIYSTHPANLCRFAVLKETQAEFNIPD
jgi:Zn-dependent protease with chaperone function